MTLQRLALFPARKLLANGLGQAIVERAGGDRFTSCGLPLSRGVARDAGRDKGSLRRSRADPHPRSPHSAGPSMHWPSRYSWP